MRIMEKGRVLVTGAAGQLGGVLTAALRRDRGDGAVLAADLREPEIPKALGDGPFVKIDILSGPDIRRLVEDEGIDEIYHMAALKSSEAETRRAAAWNANVNGLYNVLDALRGRDGAKVLFPSSIAAFGPNGGDPVSLYGVTKRTGEMLCGFFRDRFDLDARALRLPGVLSPGFAVGGGGLTDFAAEIFHEAGARGRYESYLEARTNVELIYLPDALEAIRALMDAPREQVPLRGAYAVRSFAASPGRLAEEIRTARPDFSLEFSIDRARQSIAESLPTDIDDSAARADWGYEPEYTLERAAADMLARLVEKRQ
jgi:nucleoside-diphosphate-sugar epimerase